MPNNNLKTRAAGRYTTETEQQVNATIAAKEELKMHNI